MRPILTIRKSATRRTLLIDFAKFQFTNWSFRVICKYSVDGVTLKDYLTFITKIIQLEGLSLKILIILIGIIGIIGEHINQLILFIAQELSECHKDNFL